MKPQLPRRILIPGETFNNPSSNEELEVQVGISKTNTPEDFNTGGKTTSMTSDHEGDLSNDAARPSPTLSLLFHEHNNEIHD